MTVFNISLAKVKEKRNFCGTRDVLLVEGEANNYEKPVEYWGAEVEFDADVDLQDGYPQLNISSFTDIETGFTFMCRGVPFEPDEHIFVKVKGLIETGQSSIEARLVEEAGYYCDGDPSDPNSGWIQRD